MIVLRNGLEEKNEYSKWSLESNQFPKKEDSVIINLDAWNKHKHEFSEFNYIGLLINSDQNLEELNADLNVFSIIQLNFLTFKDGRPFSIARQLRKKYNFKRELRASGYMLPDQYGYLLRCGFNTIEIPEKDKEIWIKVLSLESKENYQQF